VASVIVLDASILIAYLDADDRHHQAAETLLLQEIDEIGINQLTLAEVLVVPAREDRLESVLFALSDLEVRTLPFPDDAAVRLARLRTITQLRMPDCCVLLAAEEEGARVASFDQRLTKAATHRGLVVLGLER
jgi:predicted nucleic acid-binding protein